MLRENYISNWQSTVNVLAEVFNIPVALITEIKGEHLEVIASSESSGNPYTEGHKDIIDCSGIYCERVIKTNDKLLVPNALKDSEWENNPDIEHGLIAYLGLPLLCPNGEIFGTICVLDKNENSFPSVFIKLLEQFQKHIELDLSNFKKDEEIHKKNKALEKALDEVKTLQDIIPICSYCHNIRDDEGAWKKLEEYITKHTDAQFSHGMCPTCLPKVRAEVGLDN